MIVVDATIYVRLLYINFYFIFLHARWSYFGGDDVKSMLDC